MSDSIAIGTGNTVVVSHSISLDVLNQIEEMKKIKMWTRSATIRILLKYGIIYMQMLDSGYFDSQPEKAETN